MAIPIIKKLDLNLSAIKDKSDRDAAREEIAEYLKDTILDHVSRSSSPVDGVGKFVKLSDNYKKIKSKESGSTSPNMELTGEMLDDFDVRFSGSSFSIGFHKDASESSKLKAENHNKFTQRSLKSKVPMRQFIPLKHEEFKKGIMDDINDIINNYADQDN